MLTVTFKQSRTLRLPEEQLSLEEILSKGCYKFRWRVHFLDHLWWELVLGRATMWNPQLLQVFPMMPPWSTGEYPQKDKRLSWKMKTEYERWRSVSSSLHTCESSWHQLGQKLTCVTSFENVDIDGAFWPMSKKNNKTKFLRQQFKSNRYYQWSKDHPWIFTWRHRQSVFKLLHLYFCLNSSVE